MNHSHHAHAPTTSYRVLVTDHITYGLANGDGRTRARRRQNNKPGHS